MKPRHTAFIAAIIVAVFCTNGAQADSRIARGKYLVDIIACGDCHTPGGLTPKPDMKRYMAGSDAEFVMPGEGVFVPPNLTPDKATGIGTWTVDQIVAAITTGVTPSGRVLSAAMPWPDFSHLSRPDALAIAVYLKSLPPVANKVPDPASSRKGNGEALELIYKRRR